ncbi:MAG: pyruvate ferredoxin oxidoreductase [Thermodesulfobacteriota bacterium]
MSYQEEATAKGQMEMLLGSDAVAWGAALCRPEVIAAYPITPQTHIVETLSTMVDQGRIQSQFIKVESEMSAIASCFGAAAAGCRAFTATSSHGLALMHEMLHWFSGSRLPMVLVNANRALGAPWNIWSDQGDSLSQRDTGWLQIYCATAQEALDSIILANSLAEKLMLPVMVNIDGFILSHTMEQLLLPAQEEVDAFLPAYQAPYSLNTENPLSFGAPAAPDNYYHLRKSLAKTMKTAPGILAQESQRFQEHFQRSYQAVELYRCQDADTVLLISGALAGTVQLAVDQLREKGQKVGLARLYLFRPFPQQELLQLLQNIPEILVLNRAVSFGAGGTLSQELRAAFYHLQERPSIYDVILSLGGKEIFPETILQLFSQKDQLSEINSNWF